MLRKDLAAAREAWLKDAPQDKPADFLADHDAAGRVADFHSLRHTAGSLLAASGIHPKVAQSLMRHSDINLTMSRYSHVLVGQESDAVAGLPDLSLPAREAAALTGTDPVARQIARVRPEGALGGNVRRDQGRDQGVDSEGAERVEFPRNDAVRQRVALPSEDMCRRSSTAEHRFCKPGVGGPNPPAGSRNGEGGMRNEKGMAQG